MSISLFPEQTRAVSFGLRILAGLAVLVSYPLTWMSPAKLEGKLQRWARRFPAIDEQGAADQHDAVCAVSARCRSQAGCLPRSLAVVTLCLLQRRSVGWATGFATEPFRAHAWVEVNGQPVGESADASAYRPVVQVRPAARVKPLEQTRQAPSPSAELEGDDEASPVRIRDLLPLVTPQRRLLLAAAVAGLVTAALTLTLPLLAGPALEQVMAGALEPARLAALAAVAVLTAAATGVQQYLLLRLGENSVAAARKGLVRTLLRLPISDFDSLSSGDAVSRLSGDCARLRVAVIQATVAITSAAPVMIGASIAMAWIDPAMFIAVTGLVLILSLVNIVLSGLIQRASLDTQRHLGRLSALVQRDLTAVRTVRAGNATRIEEERINAGVERTRVAALRAAKSHATISPLTNLGVQLASFAVLAWGGLRVTAGDLSAPDLLMFGMFLFVAAAPATQILSAVSEVGESLGAYTRVREIQERPIEDDRILLRRFDEPETARPAVEFDKVTFSYREQHLLSDSDPQNVLTDVSFSLPVGSRTAIVGPSGAGKSTVLQIIERFYDASAGTVRVQGCDVRARKREDLRDQLVYVEQDAPVLAGTLRENLLIGNRDADDAACVQALADVGLEYLMRREGSGLDQLVGEIGARLSGGERQRLALARALLSPAPVVLLDESTAHLDSVTQAAITRAFDRLFRGKTVLMVAHRLATITDADQILVLEHGRLVGRGTHEQLLSELPLYRQLASEQQVSAPQPG